MHQAGAGRVAERRFGGGAAGDGRGGGESEAAGDLSPEKIVEELYLLVYSRLPEAAEREIGSRLFAEKGTTRRQAAEDLMWALLNTPEFMFKD